MDFAEQVKGSVDIVGVVGEHVRLRKSGPYRYMGLCPFHNEKTPSFTVHATRQFYKCFSCGAAGDVFKFVMEIEGISFYEALKPLAERNGIPMPKRSQYADEDSQLRARHLRRCTRSRRRRSGRTCDGPAGDGGARVPGASAACRGRRSSSSGWAIGPVGTRRCCGRFEQRNFPAAQIEESGLVGRREDGSLYDRFRNRLMFPIQDETGKIIGFGGGRWRRRTIRSI